MKSLDALLAEEETVLATFLPQNVSPSQIADFIDGGLNAGMPVEAAAVYAPELARAINTIIFFPLTPYFLLMGARERLRRASKAFPETIAESYRLTVAKHEEEVRQLVANVGKKQGIDIPKEAVEIYLIGLAERIRKGVFDKIGLHDLLMRAADYGANGQYCKGP